MCGIVGMAGRPTSADHDKMFKNMLHMDVVRGEDSTGVLSVKVNKERHLIKAAVLPSDLLQFKKSKKLFSGSNVLLLGHNRAATVGSVDNQSAHPFQHRAVIGVHNGTLTGWKQDLDDSQDFDVDSDCLIHNLSVNDPKEVLESIRGAWALVWYNSKNHTLSMVRNDKRPLWLAHDNKGLGNMYWASEQWMIQVTAQRNNIEIRDPYVLPLDTIFTWELPTKGGKGLEGKPNAVKISPRVEESCIYSRYDHYRDYDGGNSSRGKVINLPPPSQSNYQRNSNSGGTTTGPKGPPDLEATKNDIQATRSAVAQYYASLMGKEIEFVPYKFEAYPGSTTAPNGTKRGLLMAYLAEDNSFDVRVPCTEEDAEILMEHNILVGKCSGTSAPWISAGTGSFHMGFITVQHNTVDVVIEEQDLAASDILLDDEEEGTDLEFKGPFGSTINREKFISLAKNGCGVCSSSVFPGDECSWFNNEPICKDCVDDGALKTIMEA